MKKYIVKYKDSEKVFGEYNSRKEASAKLMKYINDLNKCLENNYISPFDFVLEEVECKEVNEVITNFESARRYLGLQKIDFTDLANEHIILGLEKFIKVNPKHIEALIALNRLFTIAEAWNKADGFIPDFSDWNQNKWCPWFKYDKDVAGFVFSRTLNAPVYADANFGSRLCFKTEERAEQFGKQFAHLYNKVFL